tara:strand:+ start:172 stop:381 length:210 start_codon:yes stop_codon:yes gene_type:complete
VVNESYGEEEEFEETESIGMLPGDGEMEKPSDSDSKASPAFSEGSIGEKLLNYQRIILLGSRVGEVWSH